MKRYIKSNDEYPVAYNAKKREFAIFKVWTMDYADAVDEVDLIETFKNYDGPLEISTDYKKLCRILQQKYESKYWKNQAGYIVSEVVIIAAYYEKGHPLWNSEFGSLVAYQDYEGNLIEEYPGGNFDESYFSDEEYFG